MGNNKYVELTRSKNKKLVLLIRFISYLVMKSTPTHLLRSYVKIREKDLSMTVVQPGFCFGRD